MSSVLVDTALVVVISGLSGLGIALFPPYTWFALVLLLVPIGHLFERVWTRRNAQTIVTSRRLIRIDGVFEKHVSDTLIEKINDIVTRQSAWGRMLDFGDLEILTRSASGIDRFDKIAHPIGLKKAPAKQRPLRDVAQHEEGSLAGGEDAAVVRIHDIPDLIKGLTDFRDKGLISEAEFEAKRRNLMDRI